MNKYQRRITDKHPANSVPIEILDPDNLIGWLKDKAEKHTLTYLLAHADDGVIWGRVDDQLVTSYEALHSDKVQAEWVEWDSPRIVAAKKSLPPLRIETLQQARLFGEKAELFIWKDGDGAWHSRLIQDAEKDTTPAWLESFDEPQMLWGTHGTKLDHGFTLLEDGAQGLRHAVPVPLKLSDSPQRFGETTPPRLVVRHYLNKDGFAQVVVSRLVKFKFDDGK